MFRTPSMEISSKTANTSHWVNLLSRPVLAIFIDYDTKRPYVHLPMSDFLRVEIILKTAQLSFKDSTSDWVISVGDNTNNRLTSVVLLPPIIDKETAVLRLQEMLDGYPTLHLAVSSTKQLGSWYRSGTVQPCNNSNAYSYELVSIYF